MTCSFSKSLLSAANFILISCISFGTLNNAIASEKKQPETSPPQIHTWSMQYGFSSNCVNDTCKITVEYGGDAQPEILVNGKPVSKQLEGNAKSENNPAIRRIQVVTPRPPAISDFENTFFPVMAMCPSGWVQTKLDLSTGEYECKMIKPKAKCLKGQTFYETDTTFGCKLN